MATALEYPRSPELPVMIARGHAQNLYQLVFWLASFVARATLFKVYKATINIQVEPVMYNAE